MLPKQYDTVLGEEGVHLPVHALKRMMVARAYLRNAAVVIADTLIPYDLEPQAAGGLRTALRRLLRFPIRRTGASSILYDHDSDASCAPAASGLVALAMYLHRTVSALRGASVLYAHRIRRLMSSQRIVRW